jgi:hypothetical protein
MSTVTTRRGANHTFHLIMTVLTFGLWGLFVWPIAALIGRRTRVTYPAPASRSHWVGHYDPVQGQMIDTRPGYGGAPDIWQR